ncbi:TetR/AcrR family transcriptional regulator, partial [Mesorhizobium sp. M7A.F.Ca.AU.001.01.1.1]
MAQQNTAAAKRKGATAKNGRAANDA